MNKKYIRNLKFDFVNPNLSSNLGITTALIGVFVLLGWIFDLPNFKSVLPGLVTMKVNTTLGFIFSGTSLWLWHQNANSKQLLLRLTSQILAVIVLCLGLVTLFAYAFNINLGIDQLLIKESANVIATSSPGRMAPNTALCFLWLGTALIFLHHRIISVAQSLACGSFLIALLGLIGYIFGIHSLYHLTTFTAMAVHTSISFLLLSLGILLASCEYGLMKEVMSVYLGGIIARNLLPLIIGIPILNSGLFLSLYRIDAIPMELGFVIRSIMNILVLSGIVWWNARYLNTIDQKYRYTQQALQEANDNLEIRVYERTEQLEATNQALINSRLQLSNLINTLPGIVVSRSVNNDLSIEDLSDGYLSIIGYSKEELCGCYGDRTFQNLIVAEDIPKILTAMKEAIEHNIAYEVEYRIRTQSGQEKWLWEKGIETSIDGHSQTIQGFITDITPIKQTQAALGASEAKFRELAENIDEVFYIKSADWSQMLYVSPAYEEIWGQSCDQAYQKSDAWDDSIHPDDRDFVIAAGNRLMEGEPLEEEYRIIRADGDIRWISTRAFPIYSKSGRILRYVGVAADITKRKQAELQIRQLNEQLEERVQYRTAQLMDANKELEAFSYSVSHDLRSPLRAIDGFSKVLLESYQDKLDERGKHYLNRIRAGTKRMGELIDDLLQLSRVTRTEMQFTHVNLSAIAQKIAQQLSESNPGRQVEWLIAADIIVEGDSQLLRILMENLLNNAWKFTSKTAAAKIELVTLINKNQKGNYFTYIVRDNGVGFEQIYVNKLFKAFQRLHSGEEFPGTGIGLATVQRIVRRHGGHVWAKGVVGKGATFYFTLES